VEGRDLGWVDAGLADRGHDQHELDPAGGLVALQTAQRGQQPLEAVGCDHHHRQLG